MAVKIDNRKIRWGLMGAGNILNRWMNGARQIDDMEIMAVASRSETSARAKAEQYHIPEVCTYEELVSRSDIDVVYVCTVNTAHKDLVKMALQHGKAVLVEKPAGINAAEFEEMAACAKEHDTFLMEAEWTRFFPAYPRIRKIIESGEIGTVRMLQSAFAFSVQTEEPSARLFDPKQAGGSLLDVGVYDFYFADLILGKQPMRLTGAAAINTDQHRFGVDETAGFVALYDTGEIAMMTSGIRSDIPNTGFIYGSKGQIEIPYFWKAQSFQVSVGDQKRQEDYPVPQRIPGIIDEGYQYEIAHVNECLRLGKTESDIVTFRKTLEVLSACDSLRKDWGIVFPAER